MEYLLEVSDLIVMQHALVLLRNIDLAALEYPLPGADGSAAKDEMRAQLDHVLGYIGNLLPTWADNIARTYFGHATTFPITIGG